MLNDVLARIKSRLDEVGLSASAASSQAGLTRDAIRNMERAVLKAGRAGVSTRTITALAPVLQTTPGWLLDGIDGEIPEDEVYEVPLYAKISAGTFAAQDGVREADIDRHIKVSHLPKGDWFALTVDGTSMNRIAPSGSIIIVDRADDRLVDGAFYVFSLDNRETTFKRFKREPEPVLMPYSWDPDHASLSVGDKDLYVFGRVRRVITDL